MTLNTGIFDVSDPQNPDRVYSAALLCRMMAKQIRDGVVHEDGNEMAVTVTDPPAMTVRVGTGTAMVQGRFCENDAALTLAVPTAHATYPRIDRVVVRLNASPGRVIDIVVKPGTAAPGPAPPALTRTPEIWELSLAQVRVEAGATLILPAKITDERGDASLCGVACPAYLPSSQLEIVGAVHMQGKALTGLPTPSTSTDAARKGYVDAEIAGKIGGFGISQVAIDADKDWGGKSITNVNLLTVARLAGTARVHSTPSDTLRTSSDAVVGVPSSDGIKLKQITLGSDHVGTDNGYRLTFELVRSEPNYAPKVSVRVNEVQIGGLYAPSYQSYSTHSVDLSGLKAGDRIQLYSAQSISHGSCRNFRLYADYEIALTPITPVNTVDV